MAKYNGWANRDTWLVALWMNNEEPNYRYVVRNKKALLKLKADKFKRVLKSNLHIGDSVNWQNVRVTEIKADIRSL